MVSWILVAPAAFAGGIVHSITGFGAGIVMMSILPYIFGVIKAPAISSLICTILSVGFAVKYRRHLRWKLIVFPAVIYIAASTCIINIVQYIDLNILGVTFGLFLILLGLYYLFGANRFPVSDRSWNLAVSSVISGITAGLFGIGGPLMAICFLARTESREEYMGNLQMLFVLTGSFSLIARIANGIYTAELIPATLIGFLFINLGKTVGNVISEKLNADLLRKIIYIFVGLSGLITLIEQIS